MFLCLEIIKEKEKGKERRKERKRDQQPSRRYLSGMGI